MNGAAWTHEDTSRALALRGKGWTYSRIGKLLNRTAQSVQMRLVREGHEVTPAKTTRRACLCFRKPFNSAGAHNRLCADCRRKEDGGDMWRYA